jgi:glutamine cyclotransferase
MPDEMEEGWGLTHSDSYLYASDGTDKLFKIDPTDFTVVSSVHVTLPNGSPVRYINELEYANGLIYANVLPQNIIIQVDPDTGSVVNVWDMSQLFEAQMSLVKSSRGYWERINNVFNGIAYRAATNTFLVTGKNWNFLFEISLP